MFDNVLTGCWLQIFDLTLAGIWSTNWKTCTHKLSANEHSVDWELGEVADDAGEVFVLAFGGIVPDFLGLKN